MLYAAHTPAVVLLLTSEITAVAPADIKETKLPDASLIANESEIGDWLLMMNSELPLLANVVASGKLTTEFAELLMRTI